MAVIAPLRPEPAASVRSVTTRPGAARLGPTGDGGHGGPADDATALAEARAALERVEELQARIRGMEALRLDTRAVPTDPAVAALLGDALREGAVYSVEGSTTLLMAMLAGPSTAGRWAAVVGMPDFGVEAAARFGIALDRLVLVPDPGRQWLAVVAALADVIPVVAVRPPERIAPAEASRLAARLRQRGAVLLTAGEWPHAESRLRVEHSEWHGLGEGHGALTDREVTVEVRGRSTAGRGQRARVRLPGASLGFAVVPEPAALEPTVFDPITLGARRAAG